MSEQLEQLWQFCGLNDRVCPLPPKWQSLWEMLPDRQQGGLGWEPALPLILAAWHDTSALDKSLRLRSHLEWANEHGVLPAVDTFLRSLSESDWHHLGG